MNGNLIRGKYIILEWVNVLVLSYFVFNILIKLILGMGCLKFDYLKLILKGLVIILSFFLEFFWYNWILCGYLREFYIVSLLVENYSWWEFEL